MVIGGLSPMLGVVVLLILVAAVLFALNRRAVAARPASVRRGEDRRSLSPTGTGTMWPNEEGSRSAEWAWDDGYPGNGTAADTQPSTTAPTWPIGTSGMPPEVSLPVADPMRTEAALRDPVAATVDAMLEEKTTLGPPQLARLDLFRPEKVLAHVESISDTSEGSRDGRRAEQLAIVRRYAQDKLGEVQTGEAEPAEDRGVHAPLIPETPTNGLTQAPLSLTPALTLVPPLVSSADAETSDKAGTPDVDQDLGHVALVSAESADPFWTPPGKTASLPAEEVPEARDELWPDCLAVDPFTEIAARDAGQDVPVPEDVEIETGPAVNQAVVDPPTADDQRPDHDRALDAHHVRADDDQAPGGDEADAADILEAYREAQDAEAKCRAIDALADQGTDLALAALQVCLDDADPTVQLHALEAAERLLNG